jgi:hypothetical protein
MSFCLWNPIDRYLSTSLSEKPGTSNASISMQATGFSETLVNTKETKPGYKSEQRNLIFNPFTLSFL